MADSLSLDGRDSEKTRQATQKSRTQWFSRVAALFRNAELDDLLWEQVEEMLISADVGVDATFDLIEVVRDTVKGQGDLGAAEAVAVLKNQMVSILSIAGKGVDKTSSIRPLVWLFVGVNGAGKTTSIAKLTHLYQTLGKKVVLGAGDTYRAAAIEQLQQWGQRLGVDVVTHQRGADPGAVAFDSFKAAQSRGADVVIIDTAGRLHTKTNLMEELKKIHRVLLRENQEQDLRIMLTIDATTGQNGLYQARAFADAVECDGVFLSKLDGTAKGGIAVAIGHELKLPVLYIGTGEHPDDIAAFAPREFTDALFETSA